MDIFSKSSRAFFLIIQIIFIFSTNSHAAWPYWTREVITRNHWATVNITKQEPDHPRLNPETFVVQDFGSEVVSQCKGTGRFLGFNSTSTYFLTASKNFDTGAVALTRWDLSCGQTVVNLLPQGKDSFRDAALSPDGNVIAIPATETRSNSSKIYLFDINAKTFRIISSTSQDESISGLDFTPDGRIVFTTHLISFGRDEITQEEVVDQEYTTLQVWDPSGMTMLKKITPISVTDKRFFGARVKVSADNQYYVLESADSFLVISATSGKTVFSKSLKEDRIVSTPDISLGKTKWIGYITWVFDVTNPEDFFDVIQKNSYSRVVFQKLLGAGPPLVKEFPCELAGLVFNKDETVSISRPDGTLLVASIQDILNASPSALCPSVEPNFIPQ